jgi:hypothetical protein
MTDSAAQPAGRLAGGDLTIANDEAIDALWGGQAIANFIDRPLRRTFYMLENGMLPARKKGAMWVSTRSALRAAITPEVARVPVRFAEAGPATQAPAEVASSTRDRRSGAHYPPATRAGGARRPSPEAPPR